jgi:hypothetical protein
MRMRGIVRVAAVPSSPRREGSGGKELHTTAATGVPLSNSLEL